MDLIYFLFAVIANQYTKPGAKPTIRGIHTGHPSTALVISENSNLSYLNPPSGLKFIIDRRVKVDRTEFESVTPRVQGGYTTRLYYRPT